KAQLDNKITIALQDGLENLPVDVDVVSIMGMGGKLISSLLDGANLNLVRRLIIGPNKDHYELRQWLENHSFCIIAERFVRDQGHDYQLIAAVHGQMHLSEIEKQYGPYIIKECSPLFRNHIERQIALLSQALSVTNDLQKRISLLDRITILRELIA
ncbi:MAG: tRNA (adenine(22)-N(1))-methyltransferase TrmK, partial [Candidatus Izemoplasmatales bacterium]|nr:tRNA (adenine(22)-N(1))-methyltransferase TrmK [Candidatus Izemoplasmatales bacterium]